MELYTKKEILKVIKKFVHENGKGVLEILGPTASGKTGFAIEIAQEFAPAEIISVDSRQVFTEMDISSAKIKPKKMQGIPHHGLDLISPNESFSVFDFQQYGFKQIEEIFSREALPILSGGTMMWLDAISENYIFAENPEKKSDKKGKPKWPFLKIGIHWERTVLYDRINKRAEWQFENGLIEETKNIFSKYKLSSNALTSFGYKEIKDYLDKKISYDHALQINQKRNRNYAKRQLTWWRGREDVLWVDGESI